MRKYLLILSLLILGTVCAEAQHHFDRGYEAFPTSPFVKKGTWVAGGTVRYSQHVNDDFSLAEKESVRCWVEPCLTRLHKSGLLHS